MKEKLKLKEALQAILDDGLSTIRQRGADHEFGYEVLWKADDVITVEYVIDESYRHEVDSVTAFITGQGKRGKALAETMLLGARKRGLIQARIERFALAPRFAGKK